MTDAESMRIAVGVVRVSLGGCAVFDGAGVTAGPPDAGARGQEGTRALVAKPGGGKRDRGRIQTQKTQKTQTHCAASAIPPDLARRSRPPAGRSARYICACLRLFASFAFKFPCWPAPMRGALPLHPAATNPRRPVQGMPSTPPPAPADAACARPDCVPPRGGGAVGKWPASTRLSAVPPAGHLPTAPAPCPGTRTLIAGFGPPRAAAILRSR